MDTPNVTILRLSVNGVEIAINSINEHVSIQIATQTPENVVITAVESGAPGIIGPDIDFNLGELVDEAVKKQREFLANSPECEDDKLAREYAEFHRHKFFNKILPMSN